MPGVFLIGITGNIATGKSMVTTILRELGADVIDSDELVHKLYQAGSPTVNEIGQVFGSEVIGANGGVDRKALGSLVFKNADALRTLEAIVWPAVARLRDERIVSSKATVIAVDAVKLIESGFSEKCDSIWLVTADPNVQLERLTRDRHVSESEARQRLSSQPDVSWKRDIADIIIENNGTLDELSETVIRSWLQTVPENLRSNTSGTS